MDDLQYLKNQINKDYDKLFVLNLVINGWPSIPITFVKGGKPRVVLNLVINGWPSILRKIKWN